MKNTEASSSYHTISSLNSKPIPEEFKDNIDPKSALLLQTQIDRTNHQPPKDKETSFLLQSLLSNIIFLCAGSFYMTVSVWDLIPPESNNALEVYNWIGRLAPITYLVNSLIDIKLAHRIRVHRKKTKANAEQQEVMNNNIFNDDLSTRSNNTHNNSFEKMRKHAAHRRELGAALTFFIAALFGTLVIVAEGNGGSDNLQTFLDRVSIHSYMLSALFAFMGSAILRGECQKVDLNDSGSLENLGDFFFLIGSIVGTCQEYNRSSLLLIFQC